MKGYFRSIRKYPFFFILKNKKRYDIIITERKVHRAIGEMKF